MHPLVKDYLEKFNFASEILPAHHYPQTPIVLAILDLKSALLKKIDPALARISAERAILEKEDNLELILIFLEMWFRLSVQNGRGNEPESILKRIKNIPTDNLSPEFKVIEKTCAGIICGTKNNLNEMIATFTEAIDQLPQNSVIYKRIFIKICLAESCRGRLNKYLEKISEVKKRQDDESILGNLKIAEFFNLVEQANFQKAEILLPWLEKYEAFTNIIMNSSNILKLTLKIIQNYFNNKITPANKAIILKDQPPWVQSAYYLLLREPILSLESAKKDVELVKNAGHLGFLSDTFIRAELANRNHEAARWIIEQKEHEGNFLGFEHFFLARIEILAGNQEKAKYHLRKLKEFVFKYGFEKRIEIELDLACELNINLYNRLLKECDQIESTRIVINPKPIKVITNSNILYGKSDAISNLKNQIEKLAPLNIPVLITGETGTGKDLVARILHNSSPRSKEPFISVNCAAISENLLQSELFGYEKGAFTGALSNHKGIIEEAGLGTVFLDEIGDISQQLQIVLLRLLENGEYRPIGSNRTQKMACRVIAATNAPLEKLVEKNTFRKDLYYRLERFLISIPPLREHKEDICELAFYFLKKDRDPSYKVSLSSDLIKALEIYKWPGNIRELRNVMERMRFMNLNKQQFNLSDLDKEYLPVNKNILVEDKSGFYPIVSIESTSAEINQLSAPNPAVKSKYQGKKNNHLRTDTLKRMFQKYKKLSKTEAAKALNCSINSISDDINTLLNEGFIEKIEPSIAPRTHYYQIIK